MTENMGGDGVPGSSLSLLHAIHDDGRFSSSAIFFSAELSSWMGLWSGGERKSKIINN